VSLHNTFLDFQLWTRGERPCRSRGEGMPLALVIGSRNTVFYSARKFMIVCTGRLGGALFNAAVEAQSEANSAGYILVRAADLIKLS
jgi:hypothetical protein